MCVCGCLFFCHPKACNCIAGEKTVALTIFRHRLKKSKQLTKKHTHNFCFTCIKRGNLFSLDLRFRVFCSISLSNKSKSISFSADDYTSHEYFLRLIFFSPVVRYVLFSRRLGIILFWFFLVVQCGCRSRKTYIEENNSGLNEREWKKLLP